MEMSQGNSLCSYLKLAKMSFFFFHQIGKQEGRKGPPWGDWYQWEEEEVGKRPWEGEYRANTVHTCM
jgi:hypothetical protein